MSVDRQSCNNENLSHRTMYNRCKYSTTKTRIQLNSRGTETCSHSKNPSFPLPLNTNQFFQSQYGKKKLVKSSISSSFHIFRAYPRYPRGRQLARGRPEKFSAVDMIPSSFPARVSITDSAKLTDGGGLFRPLKLIGESALSILRTWPPLPLGRRFRMLMQFRRLGST